MIEHDAGPRLRPCALVVDGSLTVRMDLHDGLRDADLETLLCGSLAEARTALGRGAVSVVLVDESLPDGRWQDVVNAAHAVAGRPVPTLLLFQGEAPERLPPSVEPVAKPYDRDEIAARVATLALPVEGIQTACDPRRRRRILAVDDSPTYLQRIAEELASEDVEVRLASSGEEALVMVAEEPVDCILLDLTMPGLSGEDTCRRMRERPALREVPIIMLTADETRDAMLAGLSAGADDFLAKSDDFEVVRARVRVQLRRRRLEEEALAARERILRLEEQRRSAALLAENEARLRMTMQAADLGGWQWDGARRELTWTRRSHELLGLGAAEPRRGLERFLGPVDPADREPLAALLGGEAANGSDREVEFRVRPGTSSERWIVARGRRSGDGDRPNVLGVLSDITDRRRREEDSRRMAELQQQLMGIVGHDLRNPLSAITTSAEVIRQTAGSEPLRRLADRIANSAWRASRMIGDLLDYTQARLGGGIPVSPQEANLHEIAEQAVEELRAANPGRQVVVELSGDGRTRVDGDRIAQVVSNLVSNALAYGPPESPVRVTIREDPPGLVLTVHNDGDPIPESLLPVLFEPFRRGEDTGAAKSIGLGLYIVRQIVRAHGGSIEVVSDAERGTTFTVRLPRRGR